MRLILLNLRDGYQRLTQPTKMIYKDLKHATCILLCLSIFASSSTNADFCSRVNKKLIASNTRYFMVAFAGVVCLGILPISRAPILVLASVVCLGAVVRKKLHKNWQKARLTKKENSKKTWTKRVNLEKVLAKFVTEHNKKPRLDSSENRRVKYVNESNFFFAWEDIPLYKNKYIDGEKQDNKNTKVLESVGTYNPSMPLFCMLFAEDYNDLTQPHYELNSVTKSCTENESPQIDDQVSELKPSDETLHKELKNKPWIVSNAQLFILASAAVVSLGITVGMKWYKNWQNTNLEKKLYTLNTLVHELCIKPASSWQGNNLEQILTELARGIEKEPLPTDPESDIVKCIHERGFSSQAIEVEVDHDKRRLVLKITQNIDSSASIEHIEGNAVRITTIPLDRILILALHPSALAHMLPAGTCDDLQKLKNAYKFLRTSPETTKAEWRAHKIVFYNQLWYFGRKHNLQQRVSTEVYGKPKTKEDLNNLTSQEKKSSIIRDQISILEPHSHDTDYDTDIDDDDTDYDADIDDDDTRLQRIPCFTPARNFPGFPFSIKSGIDNPLFRLDE